MTTPYAAPESHDTSGQQTSVIGKVIAVIDFLLGAGVACMAIDYLIASLLALFVTWLVAYGLFRMRIWGWWAGMALHGLILTGSTIGYVVIMTYTVGDFGRPRNHMSIITPEGFAVILTIIYAVAVILTGLPLVGLWTRRCRRAFGVLTNESGATAND